MNDVTVCLSPELIHLDSLENKIVVVADIFRATTCMVTGLASGIAAIYPVDNVEDCFKLGKKGMVTAGERGGLKFEGFELGNSPFEYMQERLRGRSVAVTTTNGTRAILASSGADQILIGAFVNLNAVAGFLAGSEKDVLIHCAGWRGTVNLEDTLFAGALIEAMESSHTISGDPALLAWQVYDANKTDLIKVAKMSSHAKRLAAFGMEKDLEFCMSRDLYPVVAEYADGHLKLIG